MIEYIIADDELWKKNRQQKPKGIENRLVIEIFGSDGSDWRASVRDFEIGKLFIFSLNYTTDSYSDLPNEKDNDFILRGALNLGLNINPRQMKFVD